MNYFDQLPNEVIFHLCSLLKTRDLNELSKICGRFYQISYGMLYESKINHYLERINNKNEWVHFANIKTLIPKIRKITYVYTIPRFYYSLTGKSGFKQIDFVDITEFDNKFKDQWIFDGYKDEDHYHSGSAICDVGSYYKRGTMLDSDKDVRELLRRLFDQDYVEMKENDISKYKGEDHFWKQ